ncbi:hypothetical protein E9993_00375 [Labilibacter sediminis]|nr:hypothetical protein E9993_00375 [Labilibacter sediminis]
MIKSKVFLFLTLHLLTIVSIGQIQLIDISNDYVSNFVIAKNSILEVDKNGSLLINMDPENPVIELLSPNGSWDLRTHSSVAFEVSNLASEAILLNAHIGDYQWNEGVLSLNPGETSVMRILIKGYRLPEEHPMARSYEGMFGYPGGYFWHWVPMDAAHIKKIKLSLINPKGPATIEVRNFMAEGNLMAKSYDEIQQTEFPFVDKYGQYIHKEWLGKVHSDDELKEAIEKENLDLKTHPSPQDRNKYGGWAKGKKYKATGHFRVEKIDDRWWLIDPEGCLFWSHGITGVAKAAATTRVMGREKYFSSLPDKNSTLYQFAKNKKGNILTYNFTGANLYRKYGEKWQQRNSDLAHQRLKSWGMNTFGNWSDEATYLQRRTPYTVSVNFPWKKVGGKLKFPNVFDPDYKLNLEKTFEKHVATWEDDYCIGYFVDNELHGWGKIGRAVQSSPAADNAKVELVKFLRDKYELIEKLNQSWESNYASWQTFLKTTTEVTSKTAQADLLAFEKIMVELYYKTCREVIKAKAPNKLYMGSRLHNHYYPDDLGHQRWIVPLAAKYCDVVSFNRYRFVPNDLVFHDKSIDKPIIIGEFHFGALDRGMLHTGLRSVQNQEQRGRVYYEYIKGALENPYIVGAHWFQYGEQAVTGRGDGENYQIGFLDVCDTPYQETIDACREIAEQMYEIRQEQESLNSN